MFNNSYTKFDNSIQFGNSTVSIENKAIDGAFIPEAILHINYTSY